MTVGNYRLADGAEGEYACVCVGRGGGYGLNEWGGDGH